MKQMLLEILKSFRNEKNVKIVAALVIVENNLRRGVLSRGLMCEKYRLADADYITISCIYASLTNFHIHLLPVRCVKNEQYKHNKRLDSIGLQKIVREIVMQ